MAQRGRPIPASLIKQIQQLARETSIRKTARETNTSPATVAKYGRKKSS